MHAPNPPSRPQWTGKQSLLTADNNVFPVCRHFAARIRNSKISYKYRNHTEIERKQRVKK